MASKQTTKRKALILGITGQDGSYLAELLLSKGYEVHAIIRRSSTFNTSRITHLYEDPHKTGKKLFLHYGDLTDSLNVHGIMMKVVPDEVYNLGAQSHVKVSFEMPQYTMMTNALGTLAVLEAVRATSEEKGKKIKMYNASSSEMFGSTPPPQNEKTVFAPRSPYGVAKVSAHYMTTNYRESYGMFAVNGILFNHESPRRGETFVTRKITKAVAKVAAGASEILYLGNLEAKRDWGHARDYVEAMYLMLQQKNPADFVIATGEEYSVRQFCELAFKEIGITITWKGKGLNEKGTDAKTGKTLIEIDQKYFRPAEVDSLRGDAALARKVLGWKPKTSFKELVHEMVTSDIELAKRELRANATINNSR